MHNGKEAKFFLLGFCFFSLISIYSLLNYSFQYVVINQRMETCYLDSVFQSVHGCGYMRRVHRERERTVEKRWRVGGRVGVGLEGGITTQLYQL